MAITVTETDQHCVFTVTCPSYEEGTIQVFNEDDDDVTRDRDGMAGPVGMNDNGDGTFSGTVSLCGLKQGEIIQFAVTRDAEPDNPVTEIITLSHDCPECPDAMVVVSAMSVEAMTMPEPEPEPAPVQKPRVARKSKPKAKPKQKPKPKAKKPAAKAKKAKTKSKYKPKSKAKPKKKRTVKAKKAKPAKKKVVKKKRRR